MKKVSGKILTAVLFVLVVLLLAGCGAASYEMTGGPNKTTIKVKADDGKYGEGFVMDLSKNEIITIDSQLESGELQIDFMEVINAADPDEPDDWEAISTLKSVNVKPGDQLEFALDYSGDFMPTLTAVGQTNGTVIISTVKK